MAIEGDLKDLSLVDIVQLHCRRGDEAKVLLENGERRGEIYFAGGQVVHAHQDDARGKEAFYQLLNWQEAHFVIETGVASPRTTIEVPWAGLLMQTLQRIDEERGFAEEQRQRAEAESALQNLLQQLADRVDGFVSGIVTNVEEEVLADLMVIDALDEQRARAMLFQTVRQAGQTLQAIDAGRFEETITITTEYRFIMRPIEKEVDRTYVQIILNADGNIGAARMYLAAFLATWPGLGETDVEDADDAMDAELDVDLDLGFD